MTRHDPSAGVINVGNGVGFVFNAELYELNSGSNSGVWTPTGSMNARRESHIATRLSNGKVLVAGGYGVGLLASAELYDPATERWTTTGSMKQARYRFAAALLPNGKVLVAGGAVDISTYLSSAELYDPITGIWTITAPMSIAREWATATLLADGRVLIAGGDQGVGNYTSSVEIYEPATGNWKTSGPLNSARSGHAAALLGNGNVLVAGGNGFGAGSSGEFYDPGFAFAPSSRPQLISITSLLKLGESLTLTGSQFRGVAEGSSGNSQDSPGDYPLVQLRSIESGQSTFLPTTNWSAGAFSSLPVWNFPPGWALATVFANGIPSTSSILNISVPVPTPVTLTRPTRLTNGSFQFSFTNSVGAIFGVLTASNPALPLINWAMLGGVTEISPGQFQFTDQQGTSFAKRFYCTRLP